MLKYLISTVEMLSIPAVLLGMLYGYIPKRSGKQGARVLLVFSLCGFFAAVVMAYLKNKTKLIRTDTWNTRIFAVSLTAFLLFLILDAVLSRKKENRTLMALVALSASVLGFTQIFYALPDVLAYPYTIRLNGDNVFSTAYLYRLIGVIAGALLILLMCAAVRFLSGKTDERLTAVLLKAGFAFVSLQQILKIVSILRARRILPKGTLFSLTSWSANHTNYYVYGVLALALLLPFIALIKSAHIRDPYENPAQLRKLKASRNSTRRWSFAVLACFLLTALNLTAIKAYAYRPEELSAIEDCIREGDELIIPFEQVEDGHLHRFAYTTAEGAAVRFIVIKKPNGSSWGIGLDACDICGETGYFERAGQVVCNRCDVVMNVNTIGFKGGCNPKVIEYSVRDGQIIVPVSTLDTPENNRLFKPQ